MELCSDEKVVDLLLLILSSSCFSISLKAIAGLVEIIILCHVLSLLAQCLHTISEENTTFAQLVCLSSDRLSTLNSALCSSHYSSTDNSPILMFTASITGRSLLSLTHSCYYFLHYISSGILVNMLPQLPDHQQALSLVSNTLLHVLDSDIANLLLQSLATASEQTDKQVS